MEQIRYAPDGKRLVCRKCFENISKQKDTERVELVVESKKPDKIKVICVQCRYKFSVHKDQRSAMICPYCGGTKLIKDEINAEKILKEVSERPDRYC